MKFSKAIVVLIFMVLVGHSATAQSQPSSIFSAEKIDLVKSIQLYPNPAVEYLTVRFAEPHSQNIKLTIHSIIGNPVEVEREIVDEHEIRLHVKDLQPGYYFLAIKDDETSLRSSFKFLKR